MRDGKKVILLVEGDMGLLLSEKRMFDEYDCIVDTVKDGLKALDYLKEHTETTDMVIAAYKLPVLGGMELLEIVRLSKRMNSVPFVMLVSNKDAGAVTKIMEKGADDVIIYPAESAAAMKRIRNIMFTKLRSIYGNVMEDIVEKELDSCIEDLGVCKCLQCRSDIMTLALNRLKPRYVSTEKGRLLTTVQQMSWDYKPDIIRAITEGAEIVRKNPRHTK